MPKRIQLAILIIVVAAAARVFAQLAAMPPYAGLDELYHVARISFVMSEGRNPTSAEPSVPSYLHKSMALAPGALPDFVSGHRTWPSYVDKLTGPLPNSPSSAAELRSYPTANYEAQQPSLYYTLAAQLAKLTGATTPLLQLQVWRGLSAVLAVIAVAAGAFIGYRTFGKWGALAASLIAFLPTWHTLMLRASNDAIACAFLAVALALSLRSGGWKTGLLEGLMWAGALSMKLLTWPALVVLPFLWWRCRAARSRMVVVGLLCVISMAVTSIELDRRTGVAIGLFAFEDATSSRGSYAAIDYLEMLKITVASGVWTSGQHNNALTVPGIALYFGPAALLIAGALALRRFKSSDRLWLSLCAVAAITFGLSQLFHASAHIRHAVAAGETMPLGGKEGWYWFSLAPLLIPILGGYAFRTLRHAAAVALLGWMCLWDAIITEGALFRDYAGLTSPATPSALFRLGPAPKFGSDLLPRLDLVAVGPFTGSALLLHGLALVAALLATVVLVRTPSHDAEEVRATVPLTSIL